MYSDKHWASDIVMGSALGVVTGWATVRHHHERPDNKLDRIFIGAMPTPVVSERDVGPVWDVRF